MKKSSNSYAVIGLGFGDEGKGATVNSLCRYLNNPLVVRYSGGQQAGHTVHRNGVSHVFSNFGSGTLAGIPTYWSKYCTFDPVGFIREFSLLVAKGCAPVIYIDKRCPITTPYDKFYNQNSEATKHGTCGTGVGATINREEKFQSLLVGDLFYPSVFNFKLKLIKEYYKNKADLGDFLKCCDSVRYNVDGKFRFVDDIPQDYWNFIFEGSQGLLLDQNIGFFPHVTRSNVGSKNILEMGFEPELFLVTRAFQTRHGNGPMTNTDIPHNIKENRHETNVSNQFQGEFKRSLLDLDLLKYGIERDPYIRQSKTKSLVVTCMDLVRGEYRYTISGNIVSHYDEPNFVRGIADHIGIDHSRIYTTSYPSVVFNPFELKKVSNG